jgi:hypothetical protein
MPGTFPITAVRAFPVHRFAEAVRAMLAKDFG